MSNEYKFLICVGTREHASSPLHITDEVEWNVPQGVIEAGPDFNGYEWNKENPPQLINICVIDSANNRDNMINCRIVWQKAGDYGDRKFTVTANCDYNGTNEKDRTDDFESALDRAQSHIGRWASKSVHRSLY